MLATAAFSISASGAALLSPRLGLLPLLPRARLCRRARKLLWTFVMLRSPYQPNSTISGPSRARPDWPDWPHPNPALLSFARSDWSEEAGSTRASMPKRRRSWATVTVRVRVRVRARVRVRTRVRARIRFRAGGRVRVRGRGSSPGRPPRRRGSSAVHPPRGGPTRRTRPCRSAPWDSYPYPWARRRLRSSSSTAV